MSVEYSLQCSFLGERQLMFGLDYTDAAILMALAVTSCFLLSLVWRLHSAGRDLHRR
jgi:hypothetical protein